MPAAHNSGHGDIAVTVLALDGRRDFGLYDMAEVADLDAHAGSIVDGDILDVLDAGAELRGIADTDIVLLALLTVVGGHAAGHRRAHGSCRRHRREPVQGQFLPVEVHLVFGSVLVAAEYGLGKNAAFHHRGPQPSGLTLRGLEIIAIDFQLDRGRTAHSTALAHIETVEFGEELEVLTDDVGDLRQASLAVFHRADIDIHRDEVGTVITHRSEGIVGIRLAETVTQDLDLRDVRLEFFINLGRHFTRDILGRTDGKFGGDLQTSVVLGGEILRLHTGDIESQHEEKHDYGNGQNPSLVPHTPGDETGVAAGDAVQDLVDRVEEEVIDLAALVLVLQQLRAEHRDQGQGGRGGHYHNDGHNPSELLEHYAGHTADHCKGQEDAEHRQGGGDDRDTDFGSAVDGRLGRFFAPFKVRRNVLEDHYGVVHDHTYRYGQSRHRNDIQRVAGREKVKQRGQQGDRDGQDHYDGTPPAAEEDEDHQHNHEEGDRDGLFQGVDGPEDVVGIVYDGGYLDVGRQVAGDVLHLLLHAADNLHGVVAGLLLNDDLGAAGAVGEGFLRLLLKGVVNAGDIPEIDRIAFEFADNDVQEFGRILELLLDAERIGV